MKGRGCSRRPLRREEAAARCCDGGGSCNSSRPADSAGSSGSSSWSSGTETSSSAPTRGSSSPLGRPASASGASSESPESPESAVSPESAKSAVSEESVVSPELLVLSGGRVVPFTEGAALKYRRAGEREGRESVSTSLALGRGRGRLACSSVAVPLAAHRAARHRRDKDKCCYTWLAGRWRAAVGARGKQELLRHTQTAVLSTLSQPVPCHVSGAPPRCHWVTGNNAARAERRSGSTSRGPRAIDGVCSRARAGRPVLNLRLRIAPRPGLPARACAVL